jgi:hypothetical protein
MVSNPLVALGTNTVSTGTNESIPIPTTPEQTLTLNSSDPTTGDNTSITATMNTPMDKKTKDKDKKEEGNKPLGKGLELQCK